MTAPTEQNIRPATILHLHEIGFKLVPISDDGKTPRMKWLDIFENGWTLDTLSQNYELFSNVATCFGKTHIKDAQGNSLFLNCLDVDSQAVFRILVNLREPGHDESYSLIDKAIEQTYVTKTKKRCGYHIFWLSHHQNKSIKSKDCRAGFEFEIKCGADGGLASLPPSKHRDDFNFHYNNIGKNSLGINDGMYKVLTSLLKDCLRITESKDRVIFDTASDEAAVEFEDVEIEDIVDTMKTIYKQGSRHAVCLHLAGYLYRHNVSLDSAKEIFTRLCKEDEEKQSRFLTLEQTYRKEKIAVTGMKALYELLSTLTDGKEAKRIVSVIYSKILAHKDVRSPGDLAFQLAETIKKEWIFKTMDDTREIYFYQSGCYIRKPQSGERIIEIECAKLVPNVKTPVVNEVIEMIRRTTPANRDDFDSDHAIINTRNYLLNLRTMKPSPHSPDYLSVIQIPINYDRNHTDTKIIHFLYNILSPTDVPLVLEYIGYCLMRDTKLQRALLIVGEEDNGKSVLLKLIRAFLGVENTSSKTLHQLTSNRFATSDLFGKLANIFADISAKRLEDVETFKVLATGDRISAERKGKDAFDMDPSIQMIFSANTPPKPNDDMDGSYYRRWIIVTAMLRTHDYFTKKPILKDRNILDKLTVEAELSGLLNLVLISAHRLLLKQQFCKNPSVDDMRNLYQRLADPVKAWIDDKCALGPDYVSDKNEIHADYIEYCWQRRLNRLELNALGRELSKFNIQDVQRGSGKNRVHVWSGIALRKNLKDDDQDTLDS